MDSGESPPHFLAEPVATPEAEALFAEDTEGLGYVMNVSRLWAYQPATMSGLFDLLGATTTAGALTFRQRGILVTATASALGDSYCSIAWGSKLAEATDEAVATSVLRGDDSGLTECEQAMARWARSVVKDPSGTNPADVDALRTVGFTDEQIFAMTVYISLRIAFSTVNGALGASPDGGFRSTVPAAILDTVTYGRPIEDGNG